MDFTEQDKAEEWFNNSEHGKGRIAGFVPILMAEYAEYYHQSKALHTGGVSVSLPSIDNAGIIAVEISEINNEMSAQEQAFFIAGFSECIKYLEMQSNER
jgi:hypothetical protein